MYCNQPEPIEADTLFGVAAEVHYDPFPESPRVTCDRFTHIAADLDRYALGDSMLESRCAETLIRLARELFANDAVLVGFADAWDSQGGAQIGVPTWLSFRPTLKHDAETIESANKVLIHVTREKATACFGQDFTIDQVIAAAEDELATYNAYLQGEVFTYVVRDTARNDILESVCGFYRDATYPKEEADHARRVILRDRLISTLTALGGGQAPLELA